MLKTLKDDHPAVKKGTTIFLKSIKDAEDVKRLIQPATTNSKLAGGKGVVTKGRFKGLPMYSLTLEERKTCPRSCQQWNSCYGNNMPFANRIDHQSYEFESRLKEEVNLLCTKKHPQGILLRLHVLGDFFSVKYVNFWIKLKKQHPNLQIFGYSHQAPSSNIGQAIKRLNKLGAWVRWSDRKGKMGATVVPAATTPDTTPREGIICPEQTGQTAGCTTCGLCWSVNKEIFFLAH